MHDSFKRIIFLIIFHIVQCNVMILRKNNKHRYNLNQRAFKSSKYTNSLFSVKNILKKKNLNTIKVFNKTTLDTQN